MIKLVVNAPSGTQELVKVESSGSYFDPTLVVWDERIHGPLSANVEAQIGGLGRDNAGALTYDQAKFDAQVATLAAKATAAAARQTANSNALAALKAADFSNPLSAGQLTVLMKHVVRLLNVN